MDYYNFKKLSIQDKWLEKNNKWAQESPEEYVRMLIVDDNIEILQKFEKENVIFDFSYKLKDEILLTLAMEKNSYKMIDYLFDKGLTVKHRDIIGLVKNFRGDDKKEDFVKVLKRIDFNKIDYNKIIEKLDDYYYDDSVALFLEYGLESNITINENNMDKMKKENNLAFLIDKYEKMKNFEKMNAKFAPKPQDKSPKI